MNGLFEQMSNISKVHGYDILAEQVGELKKENAKLREVLSFIIKNCKEESADFNINTIRPKAEEALKVTKFS